MSVRNSKRSVPTFQEEESSLGILEHTKNHKILEKGLLVWKKYLVATPRERLLGITIGHN